MISIPEAVFTIGMLIYHQTQLVVIMIGGKTEKAQEIMLKKILQFFSIL